MSYRLNWTLRQFLSRASWSEKAAILESPYSFYFGLLKRLIPTKNRKPHDLLMKDGYKIRAREFMSLYIFNEIFIDGCYDSPSLADIDSPVIVDVGGNTGQFALRMKQKYPSSRILSFEPYPPNFEALNETVKINSLSNVTTVNSAVSDVNGKLTLFIHPYNVGGHSLFREMTDGTSQEVNIPSITLKDAFQKYNIEACDLLKLDCEGSEFAILKSLTIDDAHYIRRIIFEPTGQLYPLDELISHLQDIGYCVEVGGQHGLVIASR